MQVRCNLKESCASVQSECLCDLLTDDGAAAHADSILALAFRPAGPGSANPNLPLHLATAADDVLVRVWDCENGSLLHSLAGHRLPARTCSWAPDGRTLATGSFDGSVMLWDVAEGRATAEYVAEGGVFDVCWNADGRRLAVSTKSGHAFVVDTRR
jgi:transducin (beta)-like 1